MYQKKVIIFMILGVVVVMAAFLMLQGERVRGQGATLPPTNTPRGTAPQIETQTDITATLRADQTMLRPAPTDTFTATATFRADQTMLRPAPTDTFTATATFRAGQTTLRPAPTDTFTATATFRAGQTTLRPAPTGTFTATETPTLTSTATITPTLTPTVTFSPVPSDTAIVMESEGIPPTPTVYYPPNFTPEPQPTGIPTAMPRFRSRDAEGNMYDILNIVLIGHDSDSLRVDNVFRTDTMIVVSINRTTNTVSMLSLPRDLLVWISQWGMQRLNLAWGRGEAVGWVDGGWGLFRQTVLYNFGLELHYYALIDFDGFKAIIDRLGGVTIPVDCAIQDYLWTGDYDEDGEPIFELTTLPVGLHTLNSREALWYARSRRHGTDFDRGRRQQQILRAILAESRDLGLLGDLPGLWSEINGIMETNVPFSVMVELAPLALTIEPNQIENHFFRLQQETVSFTMPDGSNVQVPNPNQAMINLIQNFLTPPTANRLTSAGASINIYDASGQAQDSHLDVVAAERLIWEGILAHAAGSVDSVYEETTLIDYVGSNKGSVVDEVIRYLNIQPDNVIIEPNPDRTADFEVFIGQNYNSCVDRQVQEVEYMPPMTATPGP